MLKRASVLIFLSLCAIGQNTQSVTENHVRADEEFLASDALQGRGSGTRDEQIAGTFIASQFRSFGLEPAGDGSAENPYMQMASEAKQKFAAPPVITVGDVKLEYGKDFAVIRAGGVEFNGKLQRVKTDEPGFADKVPPGNAPVLAGENAGQAVGALVRHGGVLIVDTPDKWEQRGKRRVKELPEINSDWSGALILLSPEGSKKLANVKDGEEVKFSGAAAPGEVKHTWNTLAILRGTDATLGKQVILLTAHMDHLGVDPNAKGDNIYNGADDDASGVTAVLELARALAAGPKAKRTILFVTFGGEETGGQGAQWFAAHPPVPLESIAANLEFEMIGRADAKVKPDELWLTGWERTNLGPELAKHGAKLVADPHPDQNFFQRSDNYTLAKSKGIVAQTVSSFGLHNEYHRPNDDLAHLDFKHMTEAINSMVEPVRWLADSDFKPEWVAGKKP